MDNVSLHAYKRPRINNKDNTFLIEELDAEPRHARGRRYIIFVLGFAFSNDRLVFMFSPALGPMYNDTGCGVSIPFIQEWAKILISPDFFLMQIVLMTWRKGQNHSSLSITFFTPRWFHNSGLENVPTLKWYQLLIKRMHWVPCCTYFFFMHSLFENSYQTDSQLARDQQVI